MQYDSGDGLWEVRTDYYGIVLMPTVCGDGMSDVWPVSWLEEDYQAHAALPAPLRISLHEEGEGQFRAHIYAEEDVEHAVFTMVAVEDDDVPANGGGTSHLPYHARVFMTAATGDAFEIAAGESTDITHTFTVDPSWDYDQMGVACWVQKPGGTNPSPQPYGDVPIKNEVLQSAFVAAISVSVMSPSRATTTSPGFRMHSARMPSAARPWWVGRMCFMPVISPTDSSKLFHDRLPA